MPSPCTACGGNGKGFKTEQEREVLEAHIQRGSPDQHKVTFREMADEHPDADAGDVVSVLKQQEHADFKREVAEVTVLKRNGYVRDHILRRREHASWTGGLAKFPRWSVRRAACV